MSSLRNGPQEDDVVTRSDGVSNGNSSSVPRAKLGRLEEDLPSGTDDGRPLLDPREVYRESLRFERTSRTHNNDDYYYDNKNNNNNSSRHPLPVTSTLPRRSTDFYNSSFRSRTSLYPSLDCLDHTDAGAGITSSTATATTVAATTTTTTTTTTSASTPRNRANHNLDDDHHHHYQPVGNLIPTKSERKLSPQSTPTTSWLSPRTTTTTTSRPHEVHAGLGGPISSTTTTRLATRTRPAAVAVATAAEDEDDDLLAMKLAAYEGRSITTRPTTVSQLDEPSRVRTITHVPVNQHQRPVHSTLVVPINASLQHRTTMTMMEPTIHNDLGMVPFAPPSTTASTTPDCVATVVDCAPTWTATADAWSHGPTAEAIVMHEEYNQGDDEMLVVVGDEAADLDCKPPARDPGQRPINAHASAGHAVATVLDYNVHPSELLMEQAVQAELLGHDYHATAQITSMNYSNDAPEHLTTFQADQDIPFNGEEHVTEVLVIESGPMEKATVEAWSASTSGQAQVLIEDATTATAATFHTAPATFQTKPPANSTANERWAAYGQPNRDPYSMIDGEAEVVDISEEVHPAELVGEATAEAELVGPDFNTAIGVPSDSQHFVLSGGQQGAIAQADIVIEEHDFHHGSRVMTMQSLPPPQEAHATLVQQESEQAPFDVSGGIATVVLESSRSRSDPLPATPVTVLEETSVPAMPPGVSFRDYVKSEPYSGPNTHEHEASGERPGWELFPSLGGGAGDQHLLPVPIPPPAVATVETLPPIASRDVAASESSSSGKNRSKGSSASTSESSVPSFQMLSSGLARGANNVMETLFGNGTPGSKGTHALAGVDLATMSGSVLPRTLLPSSVIFSEATNSWVATINTNQKALEANNVEESSKSLRAFSVPTQKQAMALARAWAPPQMHPFASNPTCLICEAQFAVFRRACHCRNCGVCICGPCSLQWPAKMLPVTYNIKKESTVTICKACDWLCSEFRLALLQGHHDKAVALYSTGNINLTTPFANVKGELFYPVHCAVLGGNLAVLKWLVDEHCCPLRSIRISNGKVRGTSGGSSYTPILTSKGRSLLGIAIGNRNIGIIRYLVVEKRMLLSAEKSLSIETLTANLDLVLRILPESAVLEQALDSTTTSRSSTRQDSTNDMGEISAIMVPGGPDEDSGGSSDSDVCIICFDGTINCVFTPCGHQICCLNCGNHISRCPVCSVECSPMRVFKP